MKNTLPGYDEMKGYRYPAPGSAPRPNISVRMADPYDNKKFSRNLDNLEDDVSAAQYGVECEVLYCLIVCLVSVMSRLYTPQIYL
jgi:hypothetical protein